MLPRSVPVLLAVLALCAMPLACAAPIHDAAAKGDSPRLRNLLRSDRSLVNLADKDGATPLHHAVASGDIAAVRVLLQAGADVNARRKNLVTPLHVAAGLGRDEIARLLVDKGAKLDLADDKGRTAKQIAKERGHKSTFTYLDSLDHGTGAGAHSGPPWVLYPGGTVEGICPDQARNCIWYTDQGKLCKLDLATDKTAVVTDGEQQGRICAHVLALDGSRLWIAGLSPFGREGAGGLSMYDIPSRTLLVYRSENTKEGDKQGLPSNFVEFMTLDGDTIWVYQHNQLGPYGLTRFLPKAESHDARWTHYTVENTESREHAGDGLASNTVQAIVPYRDHYLVFAGRGIFQEFDPKAHTFGNNWLLPPPSGNVYAPNKVLVESPRGERAEVWWNPNSGSDFYSFAALQGRKIWFRPALMGDGKWGDRLGYGALVCWDPDANTYLHMNPASTESRGGAQDGMYDLPQHICIDGDDIWMPSSWNVLRFTNGNVTRYNQKTREFTQYRDSTGGGFPKIRDIFSVVATGDSVYFGTSSGLLRYHKSDRRPAVTGSFPAADAENVAVGKDLWAEFDMPMNPETINAGSVELLVNGALCAGKVRYDAKAGRAVFSVEKGLPGDMSCELVLKSLIQAQNGNPLPWTRIPFKTAN